MALLAVGCARDARRIAVLDLGLPTGTHSAFGCPSDPQVFTQVLGRTYRTERLSAEAIATPGALTPAAYALLVVPSGSAFPAAAAPALVEYLKGGGKLLTCGGYAFDNPVIRAADGSWVSPRVVDKPLPECGRVGAFPAASAWTGLRGDAKVTDIKGPEGLPGIAFRASRMHLWSTAQALFPACSETVMSIWAKDDGHTPVLCLELTERDTSRWLVMLNLTREWKEYRFAAQDFDYYLYGPKVGRGGEGDFVRFDRVARMSVGVDLNSREEGKRVAFSVAGLKFGDDPWRSTRTAVLPQINTRRGEMRDSIRVRPDQIGAFDASCRLADVTRAETSETMADILPKVAVEGELEGYSAVALLGNGEGGAGFSTNRCVWRPFLDCRTAAGKSAGVAGAFVRHHAGVFAGSDWAIFGVENRDLFAAGSDGAEKLLPVVARELLDGFYLHDTAPDVACWRRGETRIVRTFVRNGGSRPRNGTVRIVLADETGREVAAFKETRAVAPGQEMAVEVPWTVPPDAPDYLTISAELKADGRPCDREANGVVVWTDAVVARGPRVRCDGTAFSVDGAARFLVGAQSFWAQYEPTTAWSPRKIDEDFRQMREAGMRWTRLFLHWKNEEQKRVSDACLQLAAKHGLVLYHTPMLSNTVDEKRLAEERRQIAEIATRYRAAPHLLVDIANEPRLPCPKAVPDHRAGAEGQRTWARVNRAAAKAVRPDLLLSVGAIQGWPTAGRWNAYTYDPPAVAEELDFTDQHFYGWNEDFLPTVKDIDLRVFGKPVVVGENGVRVHPSHREARARSQWKSSVDDAASVNRWQYVLSHAFGAGCAAFSVWVWRDPFEGLFSFGLERSDGTPRPALAVVREMTRAFSRLELADNPPDTVVVIDEARRFDKTTREATGDAVHAVSSALLWWGANFSVVTSSATNRLPARVRLALRPETLPTGDVPALRRLVGERLTVSGAFFTRRPEDPETLETFCVPGKSSVGWVLWNGDDKPVAVRRNGVGLTLGPHRAGYIQLSRGGTLEFKREF